MRKITLFCAGILMAVASSLSAQNADDIAKASYNLPDGNTSSYTATLTLIDKSGKSRVREIAQYNMKDGTTKKGVTVFRSPKDVAGVSYLSFDYPDNPDGSAKDSDSWLYLPAMKKVRRVSGSSKDDDFQGTDFTYDDMGDRSVGKDTFASFLEKSANKLKAGEGVRAVMIREDNEQGPLVYDPGHPDANAEGYVERPNVNVVAEMVDMITASRAYEANTTSINAAKAMYSKALDIGK